ncbi:amino acid ABC transporter ATP-binding protein [Achromobacter ruhlandii]|uniref:Amino acid ABC transporter ATP-binding protein n=1 Tax=Achromobacter ruhlandii TaxID=72557 RepID=A0A848NDU6_9BURK|nr:amino acid ABC transporter ATP-binding protein [Achromobacter ruhlandii]NMU90738.1 amino acid ABC transporter ATP-binding protein [Achromobacter ruhlandii]
MIRLEKIEKSFGGNLVLKQVDVAIAEGSVTALIGPSGSGKSTLLRCVNLLEVPDRGTLEIGPERIEFEPGEKLSRDQVQRVRMQTGMVFQNFQLFPHQTVIGNVMEGLVTVQKWPADRARARAEELLRKVNMLDKAEAWPANLSGGQQQRGAIARALAPAPRVLLCAGPTSALDPGLAAEVVDVLRQLAAEGMTMLMATHDLRLAASVSREAVFLLDGNVVEAGASRDLFTRPRDPRTATFISTLTQDAGQIG